MRQVKNKLINVSYKGILRISPNDDDADWGAQEYFDAGQEIVVSDSDGTNLPLKFTNDGIKVDGTLAVSRAATFDKAVSFSGDVSAFGQFDIQNLNIQQDLTVGGTSTLKGKVSMKKGLDVKGTTTLEVTKIQDKNFYIGNGTQYYNLNFTKDPEENAYVLQFGGNTVQTYPLRKKLQELGYNPGSGGGGGSTSGSSSAVGDIKMSFMEYKCNEDSCYLRGWLPLSGTICQKEYYSELCEFLKRAYGDEYTEQIEISDDWFQLPDVRGMFPRFANDSGHGYGAGRRVRTEQGSAIPNILGEFLQDDNLSGYTSGAFERAGVRGWGAGNDGQGYTITFDAARCSTLYRKYDVEKYIEKNPLSDGDKEAMKQLDDYGKMNYIQGKIDALSEEEKDYYTLKETRPANFSFNPYIFSGRTEEGAVGVKHYDLEEKIKEVSCEGDAVECHKIGQIAKSTKKEMYKFAECENYCGMIEAGFDRRDYVSVFDYNLMSLTSGYDDKTSYLGLFQDEQNVGLLKSFSSELPCLTDGRNMFRGNQNMTSFTGTLPKLEKGDDMFLYCNMSKYSLNYVATALPRTTGDGEFVITTASKTFDADEIAIHNKAIDKGWKGFLNYREDKIPVNIPVTNVFNSVKSAYKMFYNNKSLTTVNANTKFDSLVYGKKMFADCPKFTTFTSPLPNLENGCCMFQNTKIQTNSITTDFPSLKYGNHMFDGCKNLRVLNIKNLASLETADMMFYGCQLWYNDLENLEPLLPNWVEKGGEHNIGLSIFFDDVGQYKRIKASYEKMVAKGWNVFLHHKSVGGNNFNQGYKDYPFPENTCGWFQDTNLVEFSPINTAAGADTNLSVSGIKNASFMFAYCTKLDKFAMTKMENLQNAEYMFYGCSALTKGSWAKGYFACDFSELVKANYMFYGCDNIKSFNCSVSKLMDGRYMFGGASCVLTELGSSVKLEKLVSAEGMFKDCKLTKDSLAQIATHIRDVSDLEEKQILKDDDGIEVIVTKKIDIGLDNPTGEDELDLIKSLKNKGWTVGVYPVQQN